MTDEREAFVERFERLGEREVPEDGFRVVFLDVGGGQSVIVQTETETLLYDAGPTKETGGKRTGPCDGEETVEALRALGVDYIDHVVVSHLDTDHYGQLAGGVKDDGEQTDGVVEEFGGDIGTIHFPGAAIDDHDLSFPEAAAAKRVVGEPADPDDADDVVVGTKKGTNRAKAKPADEADGSELRDTTEVDGSDVVRLRMNKYIEGLADVVDEAGVETAWATAEAPDAETPQIALDDVDVTVLNPPAEPEKTLSEDDRSTVLRFWHPDSRTYAYLTGDLKGNRESSVFERYAPAFPELDPERVELDPTHRGSDGPEAETGAEPASDEEPPVTADGGTTGDGDGSEEGEDAEGTCDVEKHGSALADGYIWEAAEAEKLVLSNDENGNNGFPGETKRDQLDDQPGDVESTAEESIAIEMGPGGVKRVPMGQEPAEDESESESEASGVAELVEKLKRQWSGDEPDEDQSTDGEYWSP